MGGAWDSEITHSPEGGGGRIMVCWGSTPSENAVGWSCVWLHRLISAITAQLDWPDILASFVSGLIRSMKASYRQLLLQQSFSILGVWGSVWWAASCLSAGEVGELMQPSMRALPLLWSGWKCIGINEQLIKFHLPRKWAFVCSITSVSQLCLSFYVSSQLLQQEPQVSGLPR